MIILYRFVAISVFPHDLFFTVEFPLLFHTFPKIGWVLPLIVHIGVKDWIKYNFPNLNTQCYVYQFQFCVYHKNEGFSFSRLHAQTHHTTKSEKHIISAILKDRQCEGYLSYMYEW